jgi:glycosyltransferase involved in cell wall biosynthesis
MSNTILEAMACGLPIIATRVGGTVEILDHEKQGILIPSQDKSALVEAILFLLNNPVFRKQYGQNAREAATTKFSLSRMVKNYEDMYIRLLIQKGFNLLPYRRVEYAEQDEVIRNKVDSKLCR